MVVSAPYGATDDGDFFQKSVSVSRIFLKVRGVSDTGDGHF